MPATTTHRVRRSRAHLAAVDVTTNQAGDRYTGRPGRHQGRDHPDGATALRAQRSPLQRRDADRHRDQHAGDADPRGR